MHHLSVYLRARDAGPQANNSTLRQHLLNHTNEQNSHDDAASSDESCAPKKKIMIRIKSSSTDSINDDDDGSAVVPEDDPLLCIQNHRWLSPSRPIAKALIYLLYATDLAVGTYLVTSAFLQKQISDDYGYLMSRLTSGLLLSGGSLAGICLHTPAKTLICGGNASTNKSLMIFNTSFAFIAVGIYYMLGLSLLVSPLLTKTSNDLNQADIALQCYLSFFGFGLSVLEGYRIIFIHHHFYSEEHQSTTVPSTSVATAV